MASAGAAKPRVFLSSVFKDRFDDHSKYVPLRKRIIEDKGALPVLLWAYEHFWPEGTENPEPDADMIIDRCFDGIKSCDLFVFLLTGRHGSGVRYTDDPLFVSYLELELFAASVLRKPILVLHLRGHEPEPALRDCMILLNRAYATGEYLIDDEKALYNRFRDACDQLAAGVWKPVHNGILAQLPDWLSIQRTRSDFEDDLSDPCLRFLDGRFRSGRRNANPDRAKLLLDEVASGMRGNVTQRRLMPHGAALFRLWAAMRELMDDAERTLSNPFTAPLWDRALGLWAGKASWFGLHGHMWMGPLAAINSQIELRKKFASEPDFQNVQDVREPLAARASAIYSIAQRMQSRRRKLYHYRQTVDLTTQAIERDLDAQQGSLSIRGHALMRMAQLGHIWKLWEAAADFKGSLELREMSGAPLASIGEAKTDLGFCSVLIGRPRAGLTLLQDGVTLMRSDESANGKAFLARGLRKLERAARLVGPREVAEAAHRERLTVAEEVEAFDQTRES